MSDKTKKKNVKRPLRTVAARDLMSATGAGGKAGKPELPFVAGVLLPPSHRPFPGVLLPPSHRPFPGVLLPPSNRPIPGVMLPPSRTKA